MAVVVQELDGGKAAGLIAAGRATAIACSPDGTRIIVGGEDRELLFVTIRGGLLAIGNPVSARSIKFSGDGEYFLVGHRAGASLWEVVDVHPRTELYRDACVTGVEFTSDRQRAVTVSEDHTLRLWSVPEGKELARVSLPESEGLPTSLAVAPDGRWAAVGFARAADAATHALESGTVLRVDLPR